MDPQQMAQFVGSIPPVGGQPQQPQQVMPMAPEPPVFQPSSAPMFPAAPAAPMMGQSPAPGAQFQPQQPTWPQMPQFPQQPAAPVMPGGTIFQQPGQVQQPQQPGQPGEIPLVPQFQLPGQQQEQIPTWAQGLIEQVQQMQNNGPQDDQPWDDNNRPRTWAEMQQAIEKTADARAQALVQGITNQQQQEAQQAAVLQQQANQNLDIVENQLSQMGVLPAVVNPADPNDPGKLARQELYAYAIAMGASEPQNLGPAAMSLHTMHQNGQYFDRTKNAIVTRNSAAPGAFAPIAGAGATMAGGGAAGGGQVTGPTVGQLATMNLSSIAQMGARALGIGQ